MSMLGNIATASEMRLLLQRMKEWEELPEKEQLENIRKYVEDVYETAKLGWR